jgi:hypothetical protein
VRCSLLRCSAVAQGNGWVQPALHGARGQAHHSACRRCVVLHCAAAKSLGNSSAPALATPPMRGRLSQPLSVPRLTLTSGPPLQACGCLDLLPFCRLAL